MNSKTLFVILYLAISMAGFKNCVAKANNNTGIQDSIKRKSKLRIQYINGALQLQKIMAFENISANDLYTNVIQWATSTYNSSGDVIKVNNENELIQIEGIEPGIILFHFPRSTAVLKYRLNIEIEDN